MPESFFSSALNKSAASQCFGPYLQYLLLQATEKNLIEKRKHSFHDLKRGRYTLTLYDMQGINTLIKAIDSVGDPPLPIPNREVKPDSADGTAKICGRVGHRHFLRKGALVNTKAPFLHTMVTKIKDLD